MKKFALAALLSAMPVVAQESSTSVWPPHYPTSQGHAVVIRLDPATCVAGPVRILGEVLGCRPDNTIILGVPIDAKPGTEWVEDIHNHQVAALEIAKTDFRGTRAKPKPRPSSPRLEREKIRKEEAFDFQWPLAGARRRLRTPLWAPVAQEYRITDRFGPYHAGIDIAAPTGGGWEINTPDALAIAPGVVVLSERLLLEGETVIVYYGDGVYASYCHLASREVKESDRVSAGTRIGVIGKTGAAKGVHLHLTVRIRNTNVDPLEAMATLNRSL